MYSRHALWASFFAVALLAGSATTHAKTLERAEHALQRLFPKASIAQADILLSEEEQKTAGELLGKPIDQSLILMYRITTAEGLQHSAYLDAHRVRYSCGTLI